MDLCNALAPLRQFCPQPQGREHSGHFWGQQGWLETPCKHYLLSFDLGLQSWWCWRERCCHPWGTMGVACSSSSAAWLCGWCHHWVGDSPFALAGGFPLPRELWSGQCALCCYHSSSHLSPHTALTPEWRIFWLCSWKDWVDTGLWQTHTSLAITEQGRGCIPTAGTSAQKQPHAARLSLLGTVSSRDSAEWLPRPHSASPASPATPSIVHLLSQWYQWHFLSHSISPPQHSPVS